MWKIARVKNSPLNSILLLKTSLWKIHTREDSRVEHAGYFSASFDILCMLESSFIYSYFSALFTPERQTEFHWRRPRSSSSNRDTTPPTQTVHLGTRDTPSRTCLLPAGKWNKKKKSMVIKVPKPKTKVVYHLPKNSGCKLQNSFGSTNKEVSKINGTSWKVRSPQFPTEISERIIGLTFPILRHHLGILWSG